MRCPVCFKQSPDDAKLCYFCCAVLTPVSKTTAEITTKTSGAKKTSRAGRASKTIKLAGLVELVQAINIADC